MLRPPGRLRTDVPQLPCAAAHRSRVRCPRRPHSSRHRRAAGAFAPKSAPRSSRQIHDALASIPGVESVTAANVLPLAGLFSPYRWGTAERPARRKQISRIRRGNRAARIFPRHAHTHHCRAASLTSPIISRVSIASLSTKVAAKAFPKGNAVGQRILSRFLCVEARMVRDHRRRRAPAPDIVGRAGPRAGLSARWLLGTSVRRRVGSAHPRQIPRHTPAAARAALAKLDRIC